MPDFLLQRNMWFHYRRKVPDKWRPVLGLREWKKALKTKDRREAQSRARVLAVMHDKLIAELEVKDMKAQRRGGATELSNEGAQQRRQVEKVFFQTRRKSEELPQLDRQRRLIDHQFDKRVGALGLPLDNEQTALAFFHAAYDSLFGDNVTPPTDPDERDDWEAEQLKLRRQIDRLSPSPNRISAVGEEWLEHVQHSPDSLRKQKAHLKRFCDIIGDLPVEQIEPEHIVTLRKQIAVTGVAPPTVQKILDTIHALLNFAKKQKRLIRVNPAADIKAGRDTRPSTDKGVSPSRHQSCDKSSNWPSRTGQRPLAIRTFS